MRGAWTSCSSTSIPHPRRRRCPASSIARLLLAARAFLYSGKSQASNREDAEFMQPPTLSKGKKPQLVAMEGNDPSLDEKLV
uniref:Uncharacterized protein n=1 Tax=Triticum urartu TaxID=4572 RepID=A0A8R7TGB4_TRIUA